MQRFRAGNHRRRREALPLLSGEMHLATLGLSRAPRAPCHGLLFIGRLHRRLLQLAREPPTPRFQGLTHGVGGGQGRSAACPY
jgi:hypothetical protein